MGSYCRKQGRTRLWRSGTAEAGVVSLTIANRTCASQAFGSADVSSLSVPATPAQTIAAAMEHYGTAATGDAWATTPTTSKPAPARVGSADASSLRVSATSAEAPLATNTSSTRNCYPLKSSPHSIGFPRSTASREGRQNSMRPSAVVGSEKIGKDCCLPWP